MSKPYRIVKIISEYKVVVNAGSNDSICEGQALEVYTPGKEIIDPETNESLGVLDYVKAKLYVRDVFPKMCICANQETEVVNPLKAFSFQFEKVLPLNVDAKDISGGFEGMSKKIHVGDFVRIPS